ncbi:MAG: transglycosylase domain-containing protein [Sphingobacterium sp.]
MLDLKNIKIQIPDLSFVKQRWFIVTISAIAGLVLIGLISALAVRGDMLDKAVAAVQQKLKDDYALNFQVESYDFAGLKTVEFQKVRVFPDSAEDLASIGELRVSVKLFPLLTGSIRMGRLSLSDANITLVKKDSTANYDFLFGRKEAVDTVEQKADSGTLVETIDRVFQRVFQVVPDDLELQRVSLSFQDSASRQQIIIPEGQIDNGDYDIDVFLNDEQAKWNFKGNIHPGRQTVNVRISSESDGAQVPFLGKRYGLSVNFDELYFHLDDVLRRGNESLEVKGGWSAKNLRVFHHRLSEEVIELPEGSARGGFIVSDNTIELLPETKVQVQDFSFQPELKFQRRPVKELGLSVHTGRFDAQSFFDAIPKGLFENLEGLKVEGKIQYDLDFQVNLDDPDSLNFDSKVDDEELKILAWGNADIAALNGAYVHHAYEDTTKMRDIQLDASNPNFTPLAQIAPVLKKTVLNTEDPFFYEHEGFQLDAFQLSIATNLKEKQFKRGASTISMQLIKNLYLHRNKTMMRKFEEILLVWLMERSGQVSKDRLLEIYMNIIEWGNDVYGIKEATDYYFGKTPANIGVGESLYLSSIIPRPKTGLSSFDYTGHLKPWVRKHFNTYGYIMSRRNQLQDEQVPEAYGFYQVVLQPNLRPARPKGASDSAMTHDNIKDMVDEIDREERIRRSLIERLFGKDATVEENQEG